MSIDFKGRSVYIAGGGSVAYRKALRFLREGANVFVIAPHIDERILALSGIHILPILFSWEAVHDAFFIYAATDDERVNAAIITEAKKRNMLCGCAMQQVDSDMRSMLDEEQEGLQFALSTKGNCPGADRAFLEQLRLQLQILNQKSILLKAIRTYVLQHMEHALETGEVLRNIALWDIHYIKKIEKAIHAKQVVLLAYHGIADVGSIQTYVDQMEKQVETMYSNTCAISVFISEKITKKAQNKGHAILHCQTISACLADLQISYVVQPMLLNEGLWLQQLQLWYPQVPVGKVFCASEDAMYCLYQQVKAMYPQGILLGLYHDSDTVWKDLSLPHEDHFYTYDQIHQVHLQNQDIHVFALSMFAGYHVKKDILGKWLPYLEAQGNRVTVHSEGCMSCSFIQEQALKNIAALCLQYKQ